jgi:hypothetical protein
MEKDPSEAAEERDREQRTGLREPERLSLTLMDKFTDRVAMLRSVGGNSPDHDRNTQINRQCKPKRWRTMKPEVKTIVAFWFANGYQACSHAQGHGK